MCRERGRSLKMIKTFLTVICDVRCSDDALRRKVGRCSRRDLTFSTVQIQKAGDKVDCRAGDLTTS